MGEGKVRTEEVRLSWAAGFVDGEGYLGVTRAFYRPLNRYHYRCVLHLVQVHRAPLDELVSLFGGKVRKIRDSYGDKYDWELVSAKAATAVGRCPISYSRRDRPNSCWSSTQLDDRKPETARGNSR